jgi:hypothetical protein
MHPAEGHARIAKHILSLKKKGNEMDEDLMYKQAKAHEEAGMLDDEGLFMGDDEKSDDDEASGEAEVAVAIVVPGPKEVLKHLVELEKKGLITFSDPKMKKVKEQCEEIQLKCEELCKLEEDLQKNLKSMPDMAPVLGGGEGEY